MKNINGVLTKKSIIAKLKSGQIQFKPAIDKFQLQEHSVDLRLGFTFMVPKYWEITKKGRQAIVSDYTELKNNFEVIELEEGQYFEILPSEYVIFSTLENLKIPLNLMAVMYPRSSINRRGLTVDLSGIVDAGYEGKLIIPVRNNTSSQIIRVYPGERFCQLVFYPLNKTVALNNSRFHNLDVANTLGNKKEKNAKEVELIKKGLLRQLKEGYKISW